jgi:uncharacterized protein
MSEQVAIDSLEFARNAATLHGKIAVADLARLQDALHSSEGVLEYVLAGGVNGHGRPVLHCEVKGELQLTCQRCLGGYKYPLVVRTDLVLVKDEAALAESDNEADTDAILADPRMDVLALVEDEVLLALPISPMHPSADCDDQTVKGSSLRTGNAFAALVALKPRDQSGK